MSGYQGIRSKAKVTACHDTSQGNWSCDIEQVGTGSSGGFSADGPPPVKVGDIVQVNGGFGHPISISFGGRVIWRNPAHGRR